MIKNMMLCCLALFMTSIQASDLAKEKRWADQIVDALLDGEAVWLQADDQAYLAIHTEPDDTSSRGIIVVHGTGVHPDWDQVVKPVRVEMASRGWHTLSIQAPILHNEATYEDYVPLYPEVPARLQAAEAYLESIGVTELVIVAHSQGSAMSAYYLAGSPHSIRAFVAVGVQATQKDPHINVANSLRKISIPILDLYGSEDLPGVLETAEQRHTAARQNSAYAQQVVSGAGHFFDNHNSELIEAIALWLEDLDL